MTSLEHLLPAPDQAPRCSDHARSLAVDPGGSAIRADRVVLAETSGPWPKPVFDHPALAAIKPILEQATVPTRTLAYLHRPADGPAPAALDHPATVVTFDRTGTSAGGTTTGTTTGGAVERGVTGSPPVTERRFRLQSLDEALALAFALAENDIEALDVMAHSRAELMTPVMLVCTQGSHDVCCGSEGARFATEAETVTGLTVYRVSHTGGHRFAPTAMTLPDGRMWADLDLDLLRRVLTHTGDAADVVDRCRGWWGAGTGAAQVAERAVLAAVGWDLEGWDRTVEPIEPPVGDHSRWLISAADRVWEVSVAAGRAVPTIACRRPGGLPAKPSLEYSVERIVER